MKAAKFDLSDAFYWMHLKPINIPKLGVLLPQDIWTEPLLAFPMVLPMGWTKSPGYLCVITETVTNQANQQMLEGSFGPPHCLE